MERERLLGTKPSRRWISPPGRQIGRSVESFGAGRRRTLVGAECGLEKAPAFGEVAPHAPELLQRSRQSQDTLGLARRFESVQSGSEVVVLAFQLLKPLPWGPPEDARLCLLREGQEVLRVAPMHPFDLARLLEPLKGALTDRLQHPEAACGMAAELRDRLSTCHPGASAEQRHGLRLGEGRNLVLDLALQTQPLAARNEQLEVGAGFKQRRELRRRVDHLLEVVEQQKQFSLRDVAGQVVLGPKRLRNRLGDEGCVAERSQAGPEDARLEVWQQLRRGLDRQPGLAGASGPGEGEQTGAVPNQRQDLGDLAFPADERAGRARQIRARNGLQRRETRLAELEQRDRFVKVFQPMLS